jgi:VIT1/CCC1 family predicted Fe2+/Mn2+ transporter
VLFGLIMVLTFTGSLSAAEAGHQEVRAMLVGALGCNLAWGIIDGVLYLMESLSERAHNLRTLREVHTAAEPEAGQRAIAEALPPFLAGLLDTAQLEEMRVKLAQTPASAAHRSFCKEDFIGALAVFLWVFLSTFPVVIPFLFIADARTGLRVSNAIAVVMLFVAGYAFGRLSGVRPWLTGIAMVVLGLVLVGITIALGG